MIMDNTDSTALLNPDYYSASTYVEQEGNTNYLRILVKVLIAGLIIVGVVLLYKYLSKNNYFEFSKDFTPKTPIVREEPMEVKVTKVKDVALIVEVVKVVDVEKREVVKVYSAPKVLQKVTLPIKPKVATSNELSEEYIKLVQESLGNY
ncbi:MAG: Unknown protein [uncultured Sulfurovum sp.]|uniref:Uncharacterized protein n=1 Tax=uncultured Sulfurovum sp. TaxID=269237 RepID=A0A6S6SYQ7_9BACT|nr:MAG: Unknown protein [uncultured Sulfurovum sp.]